MYNAQLSPGMIVWAPHHRYEVRLARVVRHIAGTTWQVDFKEPDSPITRMAFELHRVDVNRLTDEELAELAAFQMGV